jgi:hypothetical protein
MTDSKQDDDDDDFRSTQEREQWLRDRGVLIETAEDRKAADDGNGRLGLGLAPIFKQLAVSMDNTSPEDGVKFVWVPQDTTKPMATVTMPTSMTASTNPNIPECGGDYFPTFLKPYFADRKSIDASLLQDQATKHFAGGDLQQLAQGKITAASMNSVAAQGSVETFCLVHPADTNQYVGVYIYLDELGLLKKLPINDRATAMAAACGYNPPPLFYGDVFVGRVRTVPTRTNIDFVAGIDTDRGSAWMRRAVSENVAWQQAANQVSGSMGASQPAHKGTDGNVAQETNFSWTQEDDDIEITVPLVDANKKLLKVIFKPKSVQVTYDKKEVATILLYSAIDVDGCTWTVDKEKVIITVEKADPGRAWPRIGQ